MAFAGLVLLMIAVQLFRGKWLGLMTIGGRWPDHDEDQIRKDAARGYALVIAFIAVLFFVFAAAIEFYQG